MGKGKGFMGWAVGLLTGTAVGMLFAPRKGKDFRDRIKKTRKEGGLGHEPVLEDMKSLGEEILGVAKNTYEHSVLSDMITKWRRELEALSKDLVDDVSDFHKDKVKKTVHKAKRKAKWVLKKATAGKRIIKNAAKQMKNEIKKGNENG